MKDVSTTLQTLKISIKILNALEYIQSNIQNLEMPRNDDPII